MIKIGVLMGGCSQECEVSFNSGRTICDYIDKYKYEVIPLFIDQFNNLFILPWQFIYRGKISDFENRLHAEAQSIFFEDLSKMVDFVFLSLHGKGGEDGTIQGLFTILNIPYSGSSVLFNALSMDKYLMGKLLSQENILVPSTIKIRKNIYNHFDEVSNFLLKEQKIIIKPNNEGSSIGVFCIENIAELRDFYEKKIYSYESYTDVLLQTYIAGKEFTIIAFQNGSEWIIFDPTEIVKKNAVFSYRDKYLPGETAKITPGRFDSFITSSIKAIVTSIIDVFNPYDLIRVDGIISDANNKVYIIDINSFPGTAPSSFVFLQSAHADIYPIELIDKIIKNGLQRSKKSFALLSGKNISLSKKIKIAILTGGPSSEREISLESGRNVYYKLSREWFIPELIFVSSKFEYFRLDLCQIVKDTTCEIEDSLSLNQNILFYELKENYDFIFIALHGGDGENGVLQKQLEDHKVLFNGSSSVASAICMDKNLALSIIEKSGIDTPLRMVVDCKEKSFEKQKEKIQKLFFDNKKVFIKPNQDGCSNNVFCTENIDDVLKYITIIFESGQEECLLEVALEGMELTVGVIGNQEEFVVLPITHTVKNKEILTLEEKFLPGEGENITPANLSTEDTEFIRKIIKKTYQTIKCDGYARIDCFWNQQQKKITILEINSLPALTPATCIFHQASEIKIHPAEFLHYLIFLGYKKNYKESNLSVDFLESIEETNKKLNFSTSMLLENIQSNFYFTESGENKIA